MRSIMIGLVILAALKLYVHNEIFKDAAQTAIINAYRTHAITACRKDARHYPETMDQWTAPRAIDLSIGKGSAGIYLWDIDHPNWETEFKQPYLIVHPTDARSRLVCTYDVNADAAMIAKV